MCCGMCYPDEEKQMIGCVLIHYQCGCCPFKCCDYDNNAMCWGCVCCSYQVDPCWIPRNLMHLCCLCVPCGCISEQLIMTICCCNPGRATADPFERQKEVDNAVAEKEKAKEVEAKNKK